MHHSRMADAPHVQLPAVLDMVCAVTGGGIEAADGHKAAWMIKPIKVQGMMFGNINTGAHRCKSFVGNNFKMIDHIKRLRNKKVKELMQALCDEEETAPNPGKLIRPKRELCARLPEIIAVDVPTASMVASVNLLPSSRERGVLQLEITQPNLDLLLDDPPAEPAPWMPNLDHGNVHWYPFRNQVRCYYWDSGKSKTRLKSKGVELGCFMDDAAKLAATRTAADELQRFYDAHDNRGNNLPDTEGDPDADDRSDASESSSNEEPPQKIARTDTEHASEG